MHVSIPGSMRRAAKRTNPESEHLSATTPQQPSDDQKHVSIATQKMNPLSVEHDFYTLFVLSEQTCLQNLLTAGTLFQSLFVYFCNDVMTREKTLNIGLKF